MPIERSAGAIVFYRGNQGPEYLLLRHGEMPKGAKPSFAKATDGKEYWNFPKGHIEKNEKSEETALREIREETGLSDVTLLPGFKETERYVYVLKGEKIYKWVVWFLAESKTKDTRLSFEHVDSTWLRFEESIKKVTYPASKKLLTKANQFIMP